MNFNSKGENFQPSKSENTLTLKSVVLHSTLTRVEVHSFGVTLSLPWRYFHSFGVNLLQLQKSESPLFKGSILFFRSRVGCKYSLKWMRFTLLKWKLSFGLSNFNSILEWMMVHSSCSLYYNSLSWLPYDEC